MKDDVALLIASYGPEALLCFGGACELIDTDLLLSLSHTSNKVLGSYLGYPARAFTPQWWSAKVPVAAVRSWASWFPSLKDIKAQTTMLRFWEANDNAVRRALVIASLPRCRLWKGAVAVPAFGNSVCRDALWSAHACANLLTSSEALKLQQAITTHDTFEAAYAVCKRAGNACASVLWATASCYCQDGDTLTDGLDRFKHENPKGTASVREHNRRAENCEFTLGPLKSVDTPIADFRGAPLSCTGRIPWFLFAVSVCSEVPKDPLLVGHTSGKVSMGACKIDTENIAPVFKPLVMAAKLCLMECSSQIKDLRVCKPCKLEAIPLETVQQISNLGENFRTLGLQSTALGPPLPSNLSIARTQNNSRTTLTTKDLDILPETMGLVAQAGQVWSPANKTQTGLKSTMRLEKNHDYFVVNGKLVPTLSLLKRYGSVPYMAFECKNGTTLTTWPSSTKNLKHKFTCPLTLSSLAASQTASEILPLGVGLTQDQQQAALAQAIVLVTATNQPVSLGWIPTDVDMLWLASPSAKYYLPLATKGIRVIACQANNHYAPAVNTISDLSKYTTPVTPNIEEETYRVLNRHKSKIDPSLTFDLETDLARHLAALQRMGFHQGQGSQSFTHTRRPQPPPVQWQMDDRPLWKCIQSLNTTPNANMKTEYMLINTDCLK